MEPPPPIPATPPPAAPEAAMSLPARLLNIFAVPGDVFETIRTTRVSTANWFVPVLLIGLVTAISAIIVASQPAIQQQMREKQESAIEQKVKAGKMSREDADKIEAVMEKFSGPAFLKIVAGISGVVAGFVKVFGWGFALWMLGIMFLKVRLNYMKTVEVAGLVGMIGVLGTIVTLLLQLNLSNPGSSPSLAMTVDNFDATNPMHLMLAGLNLFDLWQVGVMALGLARLAGVPYVRASFVVFGFWLVLMSAMITLSAIVGGLAG